MEFYPKSILEGHKNGRLPKIMQTKNAGAI